MPPGRGAYRRENYYCLTCKEAVQRTFQKSPTGLRLGLARCWMVTMNNTLCLREAITLTTLAILAGFGLGVGMSAFELVCTLLWKVIYAH